MSKYTMELRYICEQEAGLRESVGNNNVSDVIEAARKSIFSFDYPLFDEEYKPVLETKILRHYYLREIGMETPGQWKFYLQTRLNEIMPYYNQLYKSELIKFDPMHDHDEYITYTKTGTEDETTGRELLTSSDSTADGKHGDTGSKDTTGTLQRDDTGKLDRETGSTLERETGNTTDITGKETTGISHNTKTTDERHTTGEQGGSENKETTTSGNSTETTTGSSEEHETTKGSKDTDGTNWTYNHDTPQGSVQLLDDGTYLTSAQKQTIDETESTTGSRDLNTSATTETTGNTGGTETVKGTTTGNTSQDETGNGSETLTGTDTVDTTNKQVDSGTQSDTTTGTQTDNSEGHRQEDTTGTEKTKQDGWTLDITNSTGQENENTTRGAKTIDDYIEHRIGKSPDVSYSKFLLEFRETFLNIDMMVINELQDLFFGLWDAGI